MSDAAQMDGGSRAAPSITSLPPIGDSHWFHNDDGDRQTKYRRGDR